MSPPNSKKKEAFSIIEIMLTVGMIGLLSFLAIPAFGMVKQRAEAATKINDIRVFTNMIEIYGMSNGQFPAFWISTELPSEAVDYLPINWTNGSYQWWIFTIGDVTHAIVWQMDLTTRQRLMVDRALDNGNLATGIVTIDNNGTLVYRIR